ncbi:MAG: DUF4832 domain-containing protein [Planctomycetota bacterium]
MVERSYAASEAAFPNPERGLYVQYTARESAESLEESTLAALRNRNITLILRLYYLKEYRDGPIDNERLAVIAKDLNAMRTAGVKCILRFAYNEEIGEPDAPIDVVLGHMRQLEPILSSNADVIAIVQAGFVGSWGEWHASTNDLQEPENARQITNAWLRILPPSRFVQVRTPLIKQMLVDSAEPMTADEYLTDTPQARLAHHNDCFLATDTDMGTYQDIDAEKAYLEQELKFLPMGGETCRPSEFSKIGNARHELRRFSWSYLHLDYHPDVIAAWRDGGLLAEAERKLGYRLRLASVRVPTKATTGQAMSMNLHLVNDGWAAPYNPRAVELVLVGKDGATHALPVDADPRRWGPGDEVKLNARVEVPARVMPGTYAVKLRLPDPMPSLRDRPEYAIRLANEGTWEADDGWHDLGVAIELSAEGK